MLYEELELNELILLAQSGDEKAFNFIILQHENYMRFVARRFRPAHHRYYEDILAHAKIGLVKAVKTFDVTRGFVFNTFMYKCAYNEICYFFRKFRKELNGDICSTDAPIETITDDEFLFIDDVIESDIGIPDETFETNLLTKKIQDAISKLSKNEQYIIKEMFFKERRQCDIATDLGITQSAISKRMITTMKRLRRNLENESIYS